MEEGRATVASAPGKVLLAGGYLVLERPLAGLVLSVSSRFFSRVASGGGEASRQENGVREVAVTVESPQFGSVTQCQVFLCPLASGAWDARCTSTNPYVACALSWSLSLAASHSVFLPAFLSVRLEADNDFYSLLDELKRRHLPLSASSLFFLPARLSPLPSAPRKTGLGSSAALVTSLVAAVLSHLGVLSPEKTEDRKKIHNLSQFVHCLAQGKVGSGFDIASACFGSQRYVRFNSRFLDPHLRSAEAGEGVNFFSLFFPSWDSEHAPLFLAPGLRLVLGDVSVGSNTPLMVSRVLAWKVRRERKKKKKKNLCSDWFGLFSKPPSSFFFSTSALLFFLFQAEHKEEAEVLWRETNACNEAIRECLAEIALCPQAEIEAAGETPLHTWTAEEKKNNPTKKILCRLREAFAGARRGLREIGERSGTPIEPPGQTRLCDETEKKKGVIVCGVPGAGGQDAVVALVAGEKKNASAALEEFWVSWEEATVLPLLVTECPEGVRIETEK